MPIVKIYGPAKDSTAVILGLGDTHVIHAISTDRLTGLPEIEKSMVTFVEFDPKDLKPGFTAPEPGVSISFTSLAMVDQFIQAMQLFKEEYLKKIAQANKTTAQA